MKIPTDLPFRGPWPPPPPPRRIPVLTSPPPKKKEKRIPRSAPEIDSCIHLVWHGFNHLHPPPPNHPPHPHPTPAPVSYSRSYLRTGVGSSLDGGIPVLPQGGVETVGGLPAHLLLDTHAFYTCRNGTRLAINYNGSLHRTLSSALHEWKSHLTWATIIVSVVHALFTKVNFIVWNMKYEVWSTGE